MKTTAHISPNSDIFRMYVSSVREDAQRADDATTEQAAYSLLWFLQTGRAFIGLDRLGAHMDRRTAKAFVARLAKAMLEQARASRGPDAGVVTGDLTNSLIARVLGLNPECCAEAACAHPFGHKFTLGGASKVAA